MSAIFGSLSPLWDAETAAAAAVAKAAASSKLGSQRGCGCVSVAVSSPLMTCFLPCLCKPFHPDPAQRKRERERETGQSSVPPPSLYPLLLCPFLPFCFPVFKSASELLCLKVGQSLNCWGVESGPTVCASVLAVIQTDIGCACLLILAVICFACKFIFQVWWAQKKKHPIVLKSGFSNNCLVSDAIIEQIKSQTPDYFAGFMFSSCKYLLHLSVTSSAL